jgi:hypothetical protein
MMQGWMKMLELQREKNQQALAQAHAARDRAQRLAIGLSIAAMMVGGYHRDIRGALSRGWRRICSRKRSARRSPCKPSVMRCFASMRKLLTCYLNPVAEHLVGLSSREATANRSIEVLKLFEKENQRSGKSPSHQPGRAARRTLCIAADRPAFFARHGIRGRRRLFADPHAGR